MRLLAVAFVNKINVSTIYERKNEHGECIL